MKEFDKNTIEHITLFERETKAHVHDCIVNDNIYYLVEPGKAGLAIGKSGANIKKLQNLLKKRIKVWEYNENIEQFAKNLVPEAQKIEVVDKKIVLTIDQKDRGKVIGKDGANIKIIREILERNAGVEKVDIK